MDFLIFAPPRCRTAWLANFLTYDGAYCYHEATSMCEKLEDFKTMGIEGTVTGNSDSGMMLFPQKILRMFPKAKVVLVKRLKEEVEKSLLGIFPDVSKVCEATADRCDIATDWMLTNVKEMLVIDFAELESEETCKRIWEFCNPRKPFNEKRWKMLSNLNVQLHKIRFDMEQVTNLLNYERGI